MEDIHRGYACIMIQQAYACIMKASIEDQMAEIDDITGRAKGGVARAGALSKTRRKEIAQRAASARWDKANDIPMAEHIGELKIGDAVLACAVLPDGTRVLSKGGVTTAFG